MIVGTAGHIDHGKTALVHALTGIDTDRLAEEKRRGITLELGFAHLALPNGRTVGVVDVPGHERFVKAMAAGAGGIDVALLVVALDEGVMPQTREHLDILRLLGVKRGLIAITKSDLLPTLGAEWLALLTEDLHALTKDTFLEGAPILPCSAHSKEGLDTLVGALAALTEAAPPRPGDGPLYLPIDRVFTLKGFGTVVTGPLLSGTLSVEDEVSLLPDLPGPFRVRGLQIHGKATKGVPAGERTAVNLAHVETEQVSRGLALVRHGELPASSMLDVEIFALPALDRPLPRRRRLLLHLGTAQVEATLALLDRDALAPGETALAQLRLAHPIAALPNQHFILRGSRALAQRGATLAGGRVLAIAPPKRRKGSAHVLAELLAAETPEARIAWQLHRAGHRGRTAAELFAHTAIAHKPLTRALELLTTRGEAVLVDKERRLFVSKAALEALEVRAAEAIERHHRAAPLEEGLPLEALRTGLSPELDPKLFHRVLAALTTPLDAVSTAPGSTPKPRGKAMSTAPGSTPKPRGKAASTSPGSTPKPRGKAVSTAPGSTPKPRGKASSTAPASRGPAGPSNTAAAAEPEPPSVRGQFVVTRDRIAARGQGRAMTAPEAEVRAKLVQAVALSGLAPPTASELGRIVALDAERVVELLHTAQREGLVQRVGESLFFSTVALEGLKARLVAHLRDKGSITTQEFKDLVGQSRKYVIPLSEYFDRERVTLRVGEKRVLRRA